jgi:hypothetical protein
MGNMGNAQNNRCRSSLQRNINLSLYSYTNFLRIREKDNPFNPYADKIWPVSRHGIAPTLAHAMPHELF